MRSSEKISKESVMPMKTMVDTQMWLITSMKYEVTRPRSPTFFTGRQHEREIHPNHEDPPDSRSIVVT